MLNTTTPFVSSMPTETNYTFQEAVAACARNVVDALAMTDIGDNVEMKRDDNGMLVMANDDALLSTAIITANCIVGEWELNAYIDELAEYNSEDDDYNEFMKAVAQALNMEIDEAAY